MVIAAVRPAAVNGASARGHSSASTMATRGRTRLVMAATMSGASSPFATWLASSSACQLVSWANAGSP
jgi:hypothetical protein